MQRLKSAYQQKTHSCTLCIRLMDVWLSVWGRAEAGVWGSDSVSLRLIKHPAAAELCRPPCYSSQRPEGRTHHFCRLLPAAQTLNCLWPNIKSSRVSERWTGAAVKTVMKAAHLLIKRGQPAGSCRRHLTGPASLQTALWRALVTEW